jgi:hypothetical protein
MRMEKWQRTMPMGRGRGEGGEGRIMKMSDEPHAKRGKAEDEARNVETLPSGHIPSRRARA